MWILNALEILIKHRRLVIVNTLIVTVIAVAIAFLLPRTYRAKATILPPESESPLSGLMGLTSGHIAMAVTNFALPLMATPSDLYASMLESETILSEVVDSLNLIEVYDSEDKWNAVANLKDDLYVKVDPDGIIVVEADAKTRELAANIANLAVRRLDDLNRRLENSKGREFSAFLERRRDETSRQFDSVSNVLREFQEQHRAISLEIQSEALITNLAKEKANLNAAELELGILRQTLLPGNPELTSREIVIRESRRRLREIEEGAATPGDSILSALDIPLTQVPGLVLKYAVLKRDVKILEMTFELLSQQLEMARLQEQRDTPTLMKLDIARPPEDPIKPRKKLIALGAMFLGFVASFSYVLFKDRVLTPESPGAKNYERARQLWHELRRRPLG